MKDRQWVRWALVCSAVTVVGCDGVDGGDDDGGTTDPTQDNIQQYEGLRVQLEQARMQVLPAGAVDDVRAAGPWLTWLDINQGFSGILHARSYPGGEEVVSEVPIGDGATPPNYDIGETLAMTAMTVGGDAQYTVIRLATGTVLDQTTMKKPSAAKYDAYGVFGDQAYIVVEDEDRAIYEWTPGTDVPQAIASFGDTNFGAWIGFAVAEDQAGTRRLVGVGTLGTYSMDLATQAVTRVPLPIQVLEGAINEYGVAAFADQELWWYDWGASEARAIHEELKASSYLLNSSYAQAHQVGFGFAVQDVAIDGTTLYYRSNSGIYAYDVASKAITPVLLDDLNYAGSGVFITYTGIINGDGALFTIGLASKSGSTGADGPIYRVGL